jgi:proteasome lid subunit RPN8/RPN11
LAVMLNIKREHFEAMIAHLQAVYPLEGCGLLAGNGRFSTQIYGIDNILRSPVAYEMDPHQQINAMLEFEARGDSMLAIFHSHPTGPQTPSETDIRQAYYPEAIYLIISLENKESPITRAFQIIDNTVQEVEWQIV